MRKKKNGKVWKCFVFICAIQTLMMVFWGTQKKGFYVDELWSYGLANSYYHPHVFWEDALEDQWQPGEYFKEYIEVEPNQRFRYDSVVYNLKNDAHPPLYFALLHTLCSLFPGTFSKWYALIPNIIYFVLAQILFFKVSQKLFKNKWLALIPVMLWGFALGTVSTVMFLRMYMLSTVCGLLTLNFHYNLIIKKDYGIKNWLLLILYSFFGYMSHYYFFIYAFFLSAFFVFCLLAKKEWKKLVWYCSSMMTSLLLVLLMAPWAFQSLFGDKYVEQAGQKQALIDILWKLWEFANFFAQDFFCNLLIIPVVLGFIGIIAGIRCFRKKKWRFFTENPEKTEEVTITLMPAVFYFIISALCSPWMSARYIYSIYPILFLMVVWFGYNGLVTLGLPAKKTAMGIMVITFILSLVSYGYLGVGYRYLEQTQVDEAIEPYYGSDCAFITYNYYRVTEKALELSHMNRVWTTVPQAARIKQMADTLDDSVDSMVVYVEEFEEAEGIDPEQIMKDTMDLFIENTDFDAYERVENYISIYENNCVAYHVYKAAD